MVGNLRFQYLVMLSRNMILSRCHQHHMITPFYLYSSKYVLADGLRVPLFHMMFRLCHMTCDYRFWQNQSWKRNSLQIYGFAEFHDWVWRDYIEWYCYERREWNKVFAVWFIKNLNQHEISNQCTKSINYYEGMSVINFSCKC